MPTTDNVKFLYPEEFYYTQEGRFFANKLSNRWILMWGGCINVIVLKLDESAPLDIVINHCGKQTKQSAKGCLSPMSRTEHMT